MNVKQKPSSSVTTQPGYLFDWLFRVFKITELSKHMMGMDVQKQGKSFEKSLGLWEKVNITQHNPIFGYVFDALTIQNAMLLKTALSVKIE